jgi:hypothetical protein
MKTKILASMIGAALLWIAPAMSWADDAYLANLQKEYKLTDAQVASLKNSGLPDPQMAMVARLSSKSGASINDILKMRSDKMGWGEIAKKLGVPPGEIGRAVAESRHDAHDKRHDDKDGDRDDRHADRDEHHESHDSGGHGKGH